MVAKTFMSLERLKNYRAYLVGEENKLMDERFSPEAYSVEKLKTLEWYKEEIESVDDWINVRLEDEVRREQDKAARAWLFPKKRPWWKRIFDKKAKTLPFDTTAYITDNEYREALGLPPYEGNEADIARFKAARLGEWVSEDYVYKNYKSDKEPCGEDNNGIDPKSVTPIQGHQPTLAIFDEKYEFSDEVQNWTSDKPFTVQTEHIWTQDQAADYKDYVKPGSDHIEYGHSTNWPPYDR